MQLTALEQAILSTVTYFDLFKLPLTCWEIHKNLYKPKGPADFIQTEQLLNNFVDNKTLEFSEGFYYLPNSRNLILLRKQRYLVAQKKMRTALRNIKIITKIPFVRAVFVCNNLAYLNAHIESDIDLAIITKPKRIWTTRFFAASIMKILHRRPTKKIQKDRICLSFFMDENSMNLKKIAYKDDIHFIYWVNQFMPVYDENNFSKEFFNANNWTRSSLPNMYSLKTNQRWQIDGQSKVKKFFEKLFSSWIGTILEKFLKIVQLKIMPNKLKEPAAADNTNVIISDKLLKFHDRDKRLEIKRAWESATQSLK